MSKSNSKNPSAASSKRREELRRTLPKPAMSVRTVLARPDLIKTVMLLVAFFAVVSAIVLWARLEPIISDGQVMTETRLKRIDYHTEDVEATAENREEARRNSPRVYRLNESYMERLETALLGLPKAAEGKTSLDEMTQELVQEYQLTEKSLAELQEYVIEGKVSSQWERAVGRLVRDELRRRPLLRSEEFQHFTTTLNRALLLPEGELVMRFRADPIELPREQRAEMLERLGRLVASAQFPSALAPNITASLAADPQPTLTFDATETDRQVELAVAAVEPVQIEHRKGEVLFRRGDVLSPKQLEDVRAEQAAFLSELRPREMWLPAAGLSALIALLIGFLAIHMMIAYPRMTQNAMRVAAMALLMAGMLGLTVAVTINSPNVMYAAAVAPTLLVAIVVLLAYDQRLALFLSGLQAALVTLALAQGIGWFILLMGGCGMMIAQLRELRHRNSLVSAASLTAIVLGGGSIALGVYQLPLVSGAITQILWNALWAGGASFGVGFLMLGILPTVERIFDITTGMTLSELSDSQQPLLRQLEQRAPGTYHHSFQVAKVAQAAADAIGVNSMLVYVGALYHDIGKMNKPEYFVENQTGGVNKHDKLSPAMSLLVIVGHVKDGVELAREYGLPRQIIHFIESHHGTTLVEYFYHAARSQAKPDRSVAEIEFRYPGPKPRMKEAAILMLADAVESATRAMPEPNPSRIESLVRDLSRKRLLDGQFDHCDLTFRELSLIEDAIVSRLCAIYHGRISYPKAEPPTAAGPTIEPGARVHPLPKAASA